MCADSVRVNCRFYMPFLVRFLLEYTGWIIEMGKCECMSKFQVWSSQNIKYFFLHPMPSMRRTKPQVTALGIDSRYESVVQPLTVARLTSFARKDMSLLLQRAGYAPRVSRPKVIGLKYLLLLPHLKTNPVLQNSMHSYEACNEIDSRHYGVSFVLVQRQFLYVTVSFTFQYSRGPGRTAFFSFPLIKCT